MLTSATGERGFTLLEMLIAVTVSAMLLTGVWGFLNAAQGIGLRLEGGATRAQSLRCLLAQFSSDLKNARPVGPSQAPGRWSGDGCSFSRWVTDRTLVTVAWERRGNTLVRRTPAAEGAAEAPQAQVYVDGLQEMKLDYLVAGDWRDALEPQEWPEAVRLRLTLGPKDARDPTSIFEFKQTVRVEAAPAGRTKR